MRYRVAVNPAQRRAGQGDANTAPVKSNRVPNNDVSASKIEMDSMRAIVIDDIGFVSAVGGSACKDAVYVTEPRNDAVLYCDAVVAVDFDPPAEPRDTRPEDRVTGTV